MKHFALAGNPNSGKTTLFNSLTGSTAHVGNWPGVTVDKKEGTYKKLDEPIAIIDLPGIYSLSPYTPEEVISRRVLLEDKPDCIINIVDVTNLERNLYLTTQIMEINVPLVIALNMMDELEENGQTIDTSLMEEKLGIPVVSISALKEIGLDELMKRAYETSKVERPAKSVLESSKVYHLIKDCEITFRAINVDHPLFHAVKLAELDELEANDHPELVQIVNEFKNSFNDDIFGNDLEAVIADSRYKYITNTFKNVKTIVDQSKNKEKDPSILSKSDKIDKVLTNKWASIPIFLVILFLIFHLTFSENLFYLGGLFKNVNPSFSGSIFEGLIWTDGGINSPGVLLQNLVVNTTDFLLDLANGLLSTSPSWVQGFICDGVLSGVFSVLSFCPQILVLFLFFSILEDSGYMARVAFILDKIFRKFGLSGRAFMPMIMGFGCSVPAMINTRTLSDENERIATVRVIPFFSCGAKLPILVAIAGGICEIFGFGNIDLITYSMYVIGILTAFVSVILMRKTTMRGKTAPFIMELPTYRVPQFKSTMYHLWDKLKHFIKKAFTIILASTIIIWFLQSFTWRFEYIENFDVIGTSDEIYEELIESDTDFKNSIIAAGLVNENNEILSLNDVMVLYSQLENDEEINKLDLVLTKVFEKSDNEYKNETLSNDYVDTSDSILASVGKVLVPIFTPCGFGLQLNENGWVFGVSAITGLIAKENVIATFSVLGQCTTNPDITNTKELYLMSLDEEGTSASELMIKNTGVSWQALIAFILFNMTTIPCFAAVSTAKGELPTRKKFTMTLLFWVLTSLIVSSIAYLVLSWWWTSLIVVSLFVLSFIIINQVNKKKDQLKEAK